MINWFNFELLEWVAIITTFIYNYLLTREKISCWIFGIFSSVAGCILFADKQLWGQLVLYLFYAAMGVYGWWYWYGGVNHQRPVKNWPAITQILVLLCGLLFSALLIYASASLDGIELKPLDVFITIFSLIATYKESRKILTGWLYWIVLNGLSTWLYMQANLQGMAFMAAIYFFLSISGFYNWRKSYLLAKHPCKLMA